MGSLLSLEGTLDTFEVMEDFKEIVTGINHAASNNLHFAVVTTTDGKKLAFSIPNTIYVLED